ncbi:hypothetical protein [Succinimonas sp.]|uniref:hypothetical protein n=1 Tax=Succinimonas sp. TaxID=1936151 RepID=UPI00386C804D
MNAEQKTLCAKIIHTAAASAAAGNAVPVPGFGVAVDLAAVLGMTVALSKVFNVKCCLAKHTIMMACVTVIRKMVFSSLESVPADNAAIRFQAGNAAGKSLVKADSGASGKLTVKHHAAKAALSSAVVEAVGWQMAHNFDLEAENNKGFVAWAADLLISKFV